MWIDLGSQTAGATIDLIRIYFTIVEGGITYRIVDAHKKCETISAKDNLEGEQDRESAYAKFGIDLQMNLYHIAIDYACQTYVKHRELLSPDNLKQVFTVTLSGINKV